MYGLFSTLLIFVFTIPVHAKKQNIIIKNKAQNIVAPALVPSKSKQMRSARQEAEVDTESVILQKLESDRLKDEQKRLRKLLKNSKEEVQAAPVASSSVPTAFPSLTNWLNKGFISFGVGLVNYPGVENLSSTESPAYFFSFGGYGYGNLIFDMNVYYSKHYIIPVNNAVASDHRQAVSQPSVSMAVKFSPLRDRVKPYAGLTGAFVSRRWLEVTKSGEILSASLPSDDVGVKKWRNSLDLGFALGTDIGLANRLGLNIDFRYYFNVYTETRKTTNGSIEQVLDERDSAILSANLRYYF